MATSVAFSTPTTFEWKIKFPEGTVWAITEHDQVVTSAKSDVLGDLGCKGMNILTFLRRALHSGGSVLSVRDIGPM